MYNREVLSELKVNAVSEGLITELKQKISSPPIMLSDAKRQ